MGSEHQTITANKYTEFIHLKSHFQVKESTGSFKLFFLISVFMCITADLLLYVCVKYSYITVLAYDQKRISGNTLTQMIKIYSKSVTKCFLIPQNALGITNKLTLNYCK